MIDNPFDNSIAQILLKYWDNTEENEAWEILIDCM